MRERECERERVIGRLKQTERRETGVKQEYVRRRKREVDRDEKS